MPEEVAKYRPQFSFEDAGFAASVSLEQLAAVVEPDTDPGPAGLDGLGEKRLQLAAQPGGDGKHEALLAPREYGMRQHILRRPFQNPLARPGSPFPVPRQAGRKLRHAIIQQRRSHLERVGHGHAVNFDQDIARQIRFIIHVVENTCVRIPAAKVLERFFNLETAIAQLDRCGKLGSIELSQFGVCENAA